MSVGIFSNVYFEMEYFSSKTMSLLSFLSFISLIYEIVEIVNSSSKSMDYYF